MCKHTTWGVVLTEIIIWKETVITPTQKICNMVFIIKKQKLPLFVQDYLKIMDKIDLYLNILIKVLFIK